MQAAPASVAGTLTLRGVTYELSVRATAEQLHLRLEDRAADTVWTGTFNARCACRAGKTIGAQTYSGG